MDKYEALAELLNDKEKANEIISESVEETSRNLQKMGLDFTVDELIELAEKANVTSKSDELSEGELEDVSGGILISAASAAAVALALSVGHYYATRRWRR